MERKGSQNSDGSWSIRTHGTGTNDTPHFGPLIDQANNVVGELVFTYMDYTMFLYITADQLPGYLYEQAFD